MEKLREKLSREDFSKHILEIKQDSLTTVHSLKLENSSMYSVNFINVMDRLLVTGDFGNWVFCRKFIPSKDGYVSPYYWVEKLEILSTQQGYEFDVEGTRKQLEEEIEEYNDDHKYDKENEDDDDEDDETIEYLKRCIELTEEPECYYDAYAYGEHPSDWDCESVVKVMKIKLRLNIIFDAFNEICRRLENS